MNCIGLFGTCGSSRWRDFEARKKYKSERLTDEQRLAVVERKLKRQERLTKLNKLFGDDSV